MSHQHTGFRCDRGILHPLPRCRNEDVEIEVLVLGAKDKNGDRNRLSITKTSFRWGSEILRPYHTERNGCGLGAEVAGLPLDCYTLVASRYSYDMITALGYQEIRPQTRYRRAYEAFSGYSKYVSFSDLISHFLEIRNAVAAHTNPSLPPRFLISQDSIFEIQLFLEELSSKPLGSIKPCGLSRHVVQEFGLV